MPERTMLEKILNIVTLVALALGLGVSLIVGGCEDPIPTLSGSVPMKCVWGFAAVSVVLAGGLVLAVARMFLKTGEARRFASLSMVVVALIAALIPSPWVVGTCSWEGTALCCADLAATGAAPEELVWCAFSMDCHVSALAVWIAAAFVIIASIIQIVTSRTHEQAATKKPKLFDQ